MANAKPLTASISWSAARRQLAILWFSGGAFIFIVLFFQSILGKYGDLTDRAWGWFLPNILPSLSLIISVLVRDNAERATDALSTDRFLLRLSTTLSALYLCTVALTILAQPFSTFGAIELMDLSNYWLGPFQGLVSASLGAFFLKKK